MPTVTKWYGIAGSVPFLDVDVDRDRPLFVDPRAIRLSARPQPFAGSAVACMESFFHAVSVRALSSGRAERAEGLALLQRFEEPWETRLGLASRGFRGHGGADDVGARIWATLTTDARFLVDVGILVQIEDIPLFVDGVADDITSDLTTRIIFGPLADFTAAVVTQFPEMTSGQHRTTRVVRQVWDPRRSGWENRVVELPLVEGRELLLVPRDWVRPTLLMNPGRFYDKTVLDFVQVERSAFLNGRVVKPRKDDLRKEESLEHSRATILRTVLRAQATGFDLVRLFKSFVDSRYESVDEAVIRRKIAS